MAYCFGATITGNKMTNVRTLVTPKMNKKMKRFFDFTTALISMAMMALNKKAHDLVDFRSLCKQI